MMELLVDFHEKVAYPSMETLIEERVESGINKIDRKLTRMLDQHSEKLDEHEDRIGKLETAIA